MNSLAVVFFLLSLSVSRFRFRDLLLIKVRLAAVFVKIEIISTASDWCAFSRAFSDLHAIAAA